MVPYNVSLLSGLGSILDTKKNKLIFRLSLTLSCLSFIGIKYFLKMNIYFNRNSNIFKILLIMSFNLCFMQIHVNIDLVILVGY